MLGCLLDWCGGLLLEFSSVRKPEEMAQLLVEASRKGLLQLATFQNLVSLGNFYFFLLVFVMKLHFLWLERGKILIPIGQVFELFFLLFLYRPAAGFFFQAARFALCWSKYKGYIKGGTQILAFGLSTYCFCKISKRLGSLEQKVEQIDRNVNEGINNINADLAEIKGRMDAVIATRATIAANPWLLVRYIGLSVDTVPKL